MAVITPPVQGKLGGFGKTFPRPMVQRSCQRRITRKSRGFSQGFVGGSGLVVTESNGGGKAVT